MHSPEAIIGQSFEVFPTANTRISSGKYFFLHTQMSVSTPPQVVASARSGLHLSIARSDQGVALIASGMAYVRNIVSMWSNTQQRR